MGLFPTLMPRIRKLNLAVALAVSMVLALAFLGFLPWPVCPFREFLHFSCPMCGTTHAWLCARHGEWGQAFRANPLFLYWMFWAILSYADMWHRCIASSNSIGERVMVRLTEGRVSRMVHLAVFAAVMVYENLA